MAPRRATPNLNPQHTQHLRHRHLSERVRRREPPVSLASKPSNTSKPCPGIGVEMGVEVGVGVGCCCGPRRHRMTCRRTKVSSRPPSRIYQQVLMGVEWYVVRATVRISAICKVNTKTSHSPSRMQTCNFIGPHSSQPRLGFRRAATRRVLAHWYHCQHIDEPSDGVAISCPGSEASFDFQDSA